MPSPASSMSASSDCQGLRRLMDYPRGSKPIYSYHTLVRAALLDSPNYSRTAEEIFQIIENRFPYFKTERGRPCKSYILNTLSNTPCFSPSGHGPLKDELYWRYNPSLDPQIHPSLLTLPSMPSTSTLVSSYIQPSRAGDSWNELQISTSTKPAERCIRRTSGKFEPERRNRSERDVRPDERTLRRHAVDRQRRHVYDKNFEVENVDNSSVAKEAWSIVTHEKNGRKTGKRRKAGLKPACCVIG